MQSLGMVQFVSDSTRVSSSTPQNILDLVFSNDPLLIQNMNQLPPLSSSDHNIIDFIILLPLELTRVHCYDSDSIPHDHFNSLPNSINLPKYIYLFINNSINQCNIKFDTQSKMNAIK